MTSTLSITWNFRLDLKIWIRSFSFHYFIQSVHWAIYHWSSHCCTSYGLCIEHTCIYRQEHSLLFLSCFHCSLFFSSCCCCRRKELLLELLLLKYSLSRNCFIWTVHWTLTVGVFIALPERLSVIAHCSSWAVVVEERIFIEIDSNWYSISQESTSICNWQIYSFTFDWFKYTCI